MKKDNFLKTNKILPPEASAGDFAKELESRKYFNLHLFKNGKSVPLRILKIFYGFIFFIFGLGFLLFNLLNMSLSIDSIFFFSLSLFGIISVLFGVKIIWSQIKK